MGSTGFLVPSENSAGWLAGDRKHLQVPSLESVAAPPNKMLRTDEQSQPRLEGTYAERPGAAVSN